MSDQAGNEPGGNSEARTEVLRRSLRYVMLAWVFGSAWMYIASGAALTRFAQQMNVSKFGFGLLAALPYLGALAQLPTSYFIERYGHQKVLFIGAGMLHRLVWIFMALLPWCLPRAYWSAGLIGLVFLSATIGHVSTPVWYSWMGDLVPARARGRYFSRRTQLGQLVGLGVMLGVGPLLDFASTREQAFLLTTLSALFAVAGLCGMIDFVFFLPVPPPSKHTPNPGVRFWAMIRQPFQDRNFRRFAMFSACLTFATGYVGQFVWLQLLDVAGLTNTEATWLLGIIPLMIMMVCYPFWGRVIDRIGRKPVLIIGGILIVNGATGWIFMSREHWWQGYLMAVIATAAWPGVELANFNILLGMSESLSGRRYGLAYVAALSIVVAIAGILSGLFGGAVAELIGDWRGTLWLWPITYHGILFLLSTLFRLGALFFLIGLEDSRAYSTRAALRYMGTTIYSNLHNVAVVPVRALARLGRLAYKIRP